MKRGPIVDPSRHSCCLIVPDPVRSDKLWKEFRIDKSTAFHLWKSGRCAGQMFRGQLVLARTDVERLKEKAPVISRG